LRTCTGASRRNIRPPSSFAQSDHLLGRDWSLRLADLLVVDDDRDTAGTLADLMRARGHDVRVAYDGKEGLRLARERLPDLALIDVQMPVLGGPGMVYGMIISDMGLENVPVIFMSGLPNVAEIAAEVGTPYYLRKPFALDQIEALVDRALEAPRPPAPSKSI
jgi:DNA-binding response OmpR family regulator